ncbi:hypothetical protein ED236_01055 [Pseudomethylobacillus aquaticus]|uniref:Uncharacterized protein n=1 Tax=Pseudomethylobacillus aquaticus TaxID=2676064 RepID=A0A3N0V5L5_9PROT|nr:hypothetical protein ED236_01055 [Pseudomethylobacillus aquaticus]
MAQARQDLEKQAVPIMASLSCGVGLNAETAQWTDWIVHMMVQRDNLTGACRRIQGHQHIASSAKDAASY